MADSTIALLILGGVIVLFAANRLPVGLVALSVPLALWATDVLDLEQAFAGMGDPVIVFIASLFIVSEAIDRTGLTTWAGARLAAVAGTERNRLLVAVMLLCAVMTALISLNGSVAALIPMVVALAVRAGRSPSTLLMPMVYAGSAGSLLVLAGSPVNVIVADAVADLGERPLRYFEFAWLGVPLLAVTMLIVVFLSPRLLPERTPAGAPRDLSRHAGQLAEFYELDIDGTTLLTRETGVVEAVIPPRSVLVGETVVLGARRASDLVVLAVRRRGSEIDGDTITLQPGDSLLAYGRWEALETLAADRDVLLVDAPEVLQRQVPLGRNAHKAAFILVAMVLALATGIVPPAIAGLLAAGALVLTGTLSSPQAFRAVSWETLVLVGALIPLSSAIRNTGAGDKIADVMISVIGSSSPRIALVAVFVLTVVLGLVISNTATILIVLPIGLALIAELGLNPTPVLMMLGLGASAALLTPVQTPGNLMVMGPGGYRFSDYARLGLPILLAWLAVGLVLIPLIWPL